MSAYLAIDLGAESGRAIVGVLDGERLTLHELHRFEHLPQRRSSGLHWNLTGLWSEVLEGARKGVAWAKERDLRLVSLGVDTWGVDYGLLGKSGELLGVPHAYRDERNAAAFEKTLAKVGRESIYRATGVQFMAVNTLYQLVAHNEAEPEVLARAETLLFMPDLMHYFFTGKAVVEATIASTSQMIDPHSGDWAFDLVKEAGLPTRMLGRIVPSGTVVGRLLPAVGDEIGAAEDLQVVAPAAHDTASAVAAAPADTATDWCYLSSGTWSLLGVELDRPCLSDAARDAPFTNEGGVGGTIRFLKNITGLWLLQECRREFERRGEKHDYADLTRAAGEAEPFRTLVDPEYEPFSSPGGMPQKIVEYARATGQPEPATVGQFARCCLESLALAYQHALSQLEQVLGKTFDAMHVVGGGARNGLLNQMTADAIGRRVVVGPVEATAIGNVLTQALGSGSVRNRHQIRHIVSASVTPAVVEPRGGLEWGGAYDRFLELVRR